MTASQAQLSHQVSVHPFLRGLPAEYVAAMADCAERADYETGTHLFRQGDPADRFLLLRSGLVSLEVAEDEHHYRTIQMLKEGDALGWSWLFAPYVWAFDARAETLVHAVSFDASRLRDLCDQNHELGYLLLLRIAGVMSVRLQATRRQVLELSRPAY